MNFTRNYPIVTVTKKAQISLENGHPWVFDAEILKMIPEKFENGSLVDVVSEKGRYLGTGFFSELSKIRVRIVSKNANDKFDDDFWRRRVRYAIDYRKCVMGEDFSACRLIFGEADHFPGLTVDFFDDVAVAQTLSIGMEKLKTKIFPLIVEQLKAVGVEIRGIYERNDAAIRKLEGLDEGKGWSLCVPHWGETTCLIRENGILFTVDFENGQKTGFFLDQKYNRRAVGSLAKGKKVLDCFTHTGSFALNAATNGALSVTAVDVSELAIERARANAEQNNLHNINFLCKNVFDLLPELENKRQNDYDLIILDPPAFTKSRSTVDSAYRGYKEINYRAMKLLPRGGYLATCSCSHFMENSRFVNMLRAAASDAKVELRQIEVRQQSPDHPILWGVPETDYLKFYIFQVV